jgi:hypothetical protein
MEAPHRKRVIDLIALLIRPTRLVHFPPPEPVTRPTVRTHVRL